MRQLQRPAVPEAGSATTAPATTAPATTGSAGPRVLIRIMGVGTATPPRSYTQQELLKLFGLQDPVARRVFGAPHITKRHLILPEPAKDTGRLPPEPAGTLIEKFRRGALDLGRDAIRRALSDSGTRPEDIAFIVCVTSTGFAVPGLTCLYIRDLGLPTTCRRLDVVGMGCNAGLNGLAALVGFMLAQPGRRGLLVCCEVNSSIYCRDDTPGDGIVNSLFGDGAAAIVVGADTVGGASSQPRPQPRLLDFESHMIPEEWAAMRFDWHDELACWRFRVSRDIPQVLGAQCAVPVNRLLDRNGMRRRDIGHWIIHTGGGAVIDAVKRGLGLTEHAVRHTRAVLRDFGNLSSGSFLFSYERLQREGAPRAGDYGVMMAMGPGAQIETALLQW